MIKNGNFSSISDVVNTSTIFFLGELSIEKTNPNFDYASFIGSADDKSPRAKISVALNGYVDDELENLVKVTQKSKSFIVRAALFRFFEVYSKIEKPIKPIAIPEEKLLVSKNELEELVHEIMKKIYNEK